MHTLKHSFTSKVKRQLIAGDVLVPDNQAMLDTREILRKRLRQAMDEAEISNTTLAETVGVSLQAVGEWLKTGKIARERLPVIARAVNKSVGWLLGETMRPIEPSGRKIPLIDYTQAARSKAAVDGYAAGAVMDEVTLYGEEAERCGPYCFALKVDGESMLPDFRPGDVLVVDPNEPHRPGNIVVAKLERDDTAILRKYRSRGRDEEGGEIFELAPLNDDYPTIIVSASNPGTIIGTVVEHHRKLR